MVYQQVLVQHLLRSLSYSIKNYSDKTFNKCPLWWDRTTLSWYEKTLDIIRDKNHVTIGFAGIGGDGELLITWIEIEEQLEKL